jgi:cobalt-zinc-cadmium efflux system outer membrane protein
LRDAILRRSHELAAAEALAAQADAQAARARAERTPDPTLGIRAFSDRGGMEKGAGLSLTIPLGGGYRAAQASKAAAQASAAQGELQATRLTITETANTDLAEAEASLTVWQQSRAAVEAQVAALQKLRRGQQLGEISLSEVLLAERMVQDAFRAEAVARTDAMRAITRLRIDSHQLWIDDDEG